MEILNAEIFQLAQTILQEKNIPFSYIYKLDDN
jgi:hypothetical protein